MVEGIYILHMKKNYFCRLQSFTPHQTLSVAGRKVGKKEKENQLLGHQISIALVPQSNIFKQTKIDWNTALGLTKFELIIN